LYKFCGDKILWSDSEKRKPKQNNGEPIKVSKSKANIPDNINREQQTRAYITMIPITEYQVLYAGNRAHSTNGNQI